MEYPTVEQVALADHRQLAVWYRFLPSPQSNQVEALNLICSRLDELGGITPELSESIGWK